MAVVHAAKALALVGIPFRPQGRGRDGLDCVGLCLAAYRLPAGLVRIDYRLRGNHRNEVEAVLLAKFRKLRQDRARLGDLMLMQPAADQLHLGIMTNRGFVHADARLRRVVETPGEPQWPLVGVYRRREAEDQSKSF